MMQGEIEDKLASRGKAYAVYVSLLLISFGWLALIVAAPMLRAEGNQLSSFVIYRSFSAVCHQMPERSFHLHGFPLGVCSRCTGIYVGFIIGLMLYPFARSLRRRHRGVGACGAALSADAVEPEEQRPV